MTTQQTMDEVDIRRRMDKWAEAIRAMDVDDVMSSYAADVVSFDVASFLRQTGAQGRRKNWVGVFGMFERPLDYEIRDLTISVGDDVAFGHSFNRLSGTLKSGTRSGGFWVRATYCFRKIDGNWLIVHDHASAPLDPGSGKALLNLEP